MHADGDGDAEPTGTKPHQLLWGVSEGMLAPAAIAP